MSRLAALCLFALTFAASVAQAQPPVGLLERAQGRTAEAPGQSVAETRRADARVNANALASERIQLALFDDVHVTARRTARSHPRSGSTLWQGKVEQPYSGDVTLAFVSGALAGSITVDGRMFEIALADGDLHIVRELNPALFPTDDPPDVPDLVSASGTGTTSTTTSGSVDGPGQIDVMVVWTPAARTALGGVTGVQSRIDLAVANANAAYANSGIATSLRLVYSGEISYTESPSAISTDLSRLAGTADGNMDGVHNLRNQYGADIVTMLGHGYASTGYCGVGYLMSSVSTGFAGSAFNVVDQYCAAGHLSYAHEVGHNQGLHHDPANAGGSPAYSYAYGYQDPNGAFRTVMSYGGATRVQHFSNPNVTYGGRLTGTSTQNNAQALNQTAATVAKFRSSTSTTCSYSITPTSMAFDESGGTATVDVTTAAGCAWSTGSSATWITVGSGGSGPGSVVVSVASNSGDQRSGRITVAGIAVNISEAGVPAAPCTFSVTPTSLSFGSGGGTASVSVSTQTGCSWTAGGGSNWTSLGAGGTGSGSVTVTAAPNTDSLRSTSLTVAGAIVNVSQAGGVTSCSYTVSPTGISFDATGGNAIVTVSTSEGCAWSVSNPASWLQVGSGGSGPGTITVGAGTNAGDARGATLTVAGEAVTVTQAAPASACEFTVSSTSLTVPHTGGLVEVSVSAHEGCSWTARSNTGWIKLMEVSGGVATFSVGWGGGSRTGSVTVAGQLVTITQLAAPKKR